MSLYRKMVFAGFIGAVSVLFIVAGCGQEMPSSGLGASVSIAVEPFGRCSYLDRKGYIYRENKSFARKWRQCGSSARGDAGATTQCLKRSYPDMSSSCLSCFGEVAQCARSSCWSKCLFNQTSAGCIRCTVNSCYGDLESCTNVNRNEIPRE